MTAPSNVISPSFSWKMDCARRGAAQSAYRVTVSLPGAKEPTWDSGEIAGGTAVGVAYAGPELKSATRYVWSVAVKDERGAQLEAASGEFTTGLLKTSDWKNSVWISPAAKLPAPDKAKEVSAPGTACFVKTFVNQRRISEAYWTVTGLGVFEAYVNGKEIGGGFLKPGFTHAQKRKSAFTVDVAPLMNKAKGAANVFAAQVSSGWWRDQIVKYAGRESAFRAQLIVRYDDGTEDRFGTDTTWMSAYAGAVVSAGIFDGEAYDARIASDWITSGQFGPEFSASRVNTEFRGDIVPMHGPAISLRKDLALAPKEAYVWNGVEGASADAHGKVRIARRCDPAAAITIDKGETLVVDFGQNAAAVPCFVFSAERGTTLEALPAEMLNDENGAKKRGNDGPEGSVYRLNLRKALNAARVNYTFSGAAEEKYRPSFTFFGYRYISITASGRTTISRIRSIPVTSVAAELEKGRLETGVADVNKLVSNVLWGQYSNYLSVPTDCPQRNERLGWAADTQVFAAAASRNADVYGFLSKWMDDMRDTQFEDGAFPGVAPIAQYGSKPYELGWGDAGVIVPYTLWRKYGDTAVVKENWDAMRRFLGCTAITRYTNSVARLHQWADWLSYEEHESNSGKAWETVKQNGKTIRRPTQNALDYWKYLGGCYWLWDAQMMAEMADAIGEAQEAAACRAMAEDARAYLRREFFEPNCGALPAFLRGMQTPNLFALKFDLFPTKEAREAGRAALLKNIADHGDCLQTGFLGTSILMDTLTYDAGAPETAYSLLLQHKNPSWLYSVDQGATTIWERWNSYVKATGFGPVGMNSFNHYAYGAVLEWMYGTMAGIREDPAQPGYRRIILAPIPDPRMGHVSASFDSPYGRIESAWSYDGGTWTWKFTIPANTTASVTVPGRAAETYVSGSYTVSIPVKR